MKVECPDAAAAKRMRNRISGLASTRLELNDWYQIRTSLAQDEPTTVYAWLHKLTKDEADAMILRNDWMRENFDGKPIVRIRKLRSTRTFPLS